MTLLTLDGINASYGHTPILREIDLEVESGEIVGIIGRNGVGKTTLMKTIIGLLQPDSGSIVYKGTDVTTARADRRARMGMGYVPQGRDVFPDLTVEQNLAMGELVNEDTSDVLTDRVYEYFPVLADRKNQTAGTMSGGEQQMLVIGRALVGSPDLLLLDEPSEGIQPSIIQQISDNIESINEELGVTVLFVEQNFEFIRRLAQRCYVIQKGSVVETLRREELQDREKVVEYLAV